MTDCDECGGTLDVITHCPNDDCCAHVGETHRWTEYGFRAGVDWAVRVIRSRVPNERAYPEHPGLDDLREQVTGLRGRRP